MENDGSKDGLKTQAHFSYLEEHKKVGTLTPLIHFAQYIQ